MTVEWVGSTGDSGDDGKEVALVKDTQQVKQELIDRLAEPGLTQAEIEKIEKKLSLIKEHS